MTHEGRKPVWREGKAGKEEYPHPTTVEDVWFDRAVEESYR